MLPGNLNGSFSNISRLIGHENDLCSNIFIILNHSNGISIWNNIIFDKINTKSIKNDILYKIVHFYPLWGAIGIRIAKNVEVRDSPNRIFGPWAWWSRGLARWESSCQLLGTSPSPPPSSPSSGNHLEKVTLTVLFFWAWIGLIWEISPRKLRQIAWKFGPRLFWKKYNVSKFQKCLFFRNKSPCGRFQTKGTFWKLTSRK